MIANNEKKKSFTIITIYLDRFSKIEVLKKMPLTQSNLRVQL